MNSSLPISTDSLNYTQMRIGSVPLTASMWLYLWDVIDEGYNEVLTRLTASGLNSISLAAAYHTGKFLTPHNPKRKLIVPEDGSVYFTPSRTSYRRIHPIVNSAVGRGDHLKRVRDIAEKHGMETRAWTVCCHNSALGQMYPDCSCETAFGDKLFHNLCPSNSDVRTYLIALISDIASQGVSTIELEAIQFLGYSHGYHHEREGITLTPAIRFLLGICFCPACKARAISAGFDMTVLHWYCKKGLETYFDDPVAHAEIYASLDNLPEEIFAPFFTWRHSVITSRLEEIQSAAKPSGVAIRPMTYLDPTTRKIAGLDPAAVASITGGVLVLGYVKDGTALQQPLSTLQNQLPGKEIIVGLQVGLPESGGKKEFLDRMATARRLGIRTFNFYNYGFIPLSSLDWVKESLQ
jgi:hypothetical protein